MKKEDYDFWNEANAFLKTVLPNDIEAKIIEHMQKEEYTVNEMQLFRYNLTQAFDMHPMIARLKLQI